MSVLRLSIKAVVPVFKKKLGSLKTDTGTLLNHENKFWLYSFFSQLKKAEKSKNTCFSTKIKGNKPKNRRQAINNGVVSTIAGQGPSMAGTANGECFLLG